MTETPATGPVATAAATSPRKRIGLRIEVGSLRGLKVGVPRLVELLKAREAGATFFFDMGPDRSGRFANRLKRELLPEGLGSPDFKQRYGPLGRVRGWLYPGPRLFRRGAKQMRAVRDAGFEVGVRGWCGAEWQTHVHERDAQWTEREMRRAAGAFEKVFGEPPRAHAAPAWQMNVQAWRLVQRLGYEYGADARGEYPFVPVHRAEIVLCPQLPTTLPTLDELIVACGGPEAAGDRLLEITREGQGEQVFGLAAESEGDALLQVFADILDGWREQNCEVVALRTLLDGMALRALPRHLLAEVPAAKGEVVPAVQGDLFLA
jgi:peptidoglycan/xylan/chitin deacetylase (PgdA/CDA1 family)